MEYEKVIVSVLDILGFKDLILKNTSEEAKSIIDGFRANIEFACTGGAGLLHETEPPIVTADPKEFKLNFNLFSDSVVIWANQYSLKEFMFLITATRNLLNSSIEYGLPLRGAISAGYLFINPFEIKSQYMTFENVIFGDSMVKAFNLEKNQIWSGCIIDPQLEDSEDQGIKSFLSSGDMGKFYCRYDVPIRNNGCESLLALNWRNMDNDRFSEEIIRNSFSSFNKGTEQKDIQNKIDNTISFYNHLKNLRVINSAD